MNGLAFISFDGSNVLLTLPDFAKWFEGWTFSNWLLAYMVVGAVYGLITHFASLPAIRRYNKTAAKKKTLDADDVVFLCLARLLIQLTSRIIALILGVIGVPIACLAFGKFRLSNPFLKYAYTWFDCPATSQKNWFGDSSTDQNVTVKFVIDEAGRIEMRAKDEELMRLLRAAGTETETK